MLNKELISRHIIEKLFSGIIDIETKHHFDNDDFALLRKIANSVLRPYNIIIKTSQIAAMWDVTTTHGRYVPSNAAKIHGYMAAVFLKKHSDISISGIHNEATILRIWSRFMEFMEDDRNHDKIEIDVEDKTFSTDELEVNIVERMEAKNLITNIEKGIQKVVMLTGMPGAGKSTLLKLVRDQVTSKLNNVLSLTFTDKVKPQHFVEIFKDKFLSIKANNPKSIYEQIKHWNDNNSVYIFLDQLEWLQWCEDDYNSNSIQANPFGEIINTFYDFREFIDWFAKNGKGLIVIGSRYFVPSLKKHKSTVLEISLNKLHDDDAIQLLKENGVVGAPKDIHSLIVKCGNHAYSLALSTYIINEHYNGDIKSFLNIDILKNIKTSEGFETAKAIIEWYSNGHISNEMKDTMRLISVFKYDYYIQKELVHRCYCKFSQSVKHYTSQSTDYILDDFNRISKKLKERKLLFEDGDSYWLHPISKQFFYMEMEEELRIVLHKLADEQLAIEHFPSVPTSIDDLNIPLKRVYHGCGAKKFDETYRYYIDKIAGPKQTFLTMTLGGWDTNLSITKNFFHNRDVLDEINLTNNDLRQRLINNVGLTLLNTGRLAQASTFFKNWAAANEKEGLTYEASINLYHLSGIEFRRGYLSNAKTCIIKSFKLINNYEYGKKLSSQFKEDFFHVQGRLAYIYLLNGDIDDAKNNFVASESGLKKISKHVSTGIIGIPIIKYGDYFLFTGNYKETIKEAKAKISLCDKGQKWLGEISRCKRSLAEAYRKVKQYDLAEKTIKEALIDARNFGMPEIILNTLLEFALLRLELGHLDSALTDIEEAKIYVGELELYMPKIFLVEARYYLMTYSQSANSTDLDLAETFCRKALIKSEKMDFYWGVKRAKTLLNEISQKKANYQK